MLSCSVAYSLTECSETSGVRRAPFLSLSLRSSLSFSLYLFAFVSLLVFMGERDGHVGNGEQARYVQRAKAFFSFSFFNPFATIVFSLLCSLLFSLAVLSRVSFHWVFHVLKLYSYTRVPATEITRRQGRTSGDAAT